MRQVTMVMGLVLVVAACGGTSSDGSGDDDGGRFDVDVPDEDQLLVGGDLDLPEWFPPGFDFTNDLAITSVAGGDVAMSLSGESEADVETAHAGAVEGLIDSGYELLSNEDNFAVFIRDGVGRVRVRTSPTFDGSATEVSVDIDLWTDEQIEELRILSSPEVTTRGSATAELDGEVFMADGECIIQGRNRLFIADDISISASVDEFADPPNVYADVTTEDGVVYYMNVDSERSYDIGSATPPVEFTVTGVVISTDGSGDEFDLAVAVTCEG